MTDITIIGTGNMARGLVTRAVAAGKSVQLLAREDKTRADSLAAELGGQVSTGLVGEAITGEIVIPAVYFDAAKDIGARYGCPYWKGLGRHHQPGRLLHLRRPRRARG